MGEPEKHSSPGPDPSTLRNADRSEVPDSVIPAPLRVTYTSNEVSDYINFKRDGWKVRLELYGPLFSLVRKADQVKDLTTELSKALGAINLPGIEEYFRAAVADYANAIFSVPAFTASIGIGLATYLLQKLYDAERLVLGIIHQASVDELPSWLGLVEEAKENPDITVS